MLTSKTAEVAGGRRGRPPGTSRRELELIALRLFTEQGFDNTTIEQIAAEAGVSKRTFFRYFGSKTSVLWSEFDHEVDVIRAALAGVPAGVPMMDAIRRAVVAANHYGPQDVPELRMRMNLIGNVPALQSSAALHYDAWERAITDFAATRRGQPADSLYPLAVGRATLAACRAAYDRWSARADADLTFYLDAALAALAAGFKPVVIQASAQALGQDIPRHVSTSTLVSSTALLECGHPPPLIATAAGPGPPLPPCAAGRVSYLRESFRGNPSRQYVLSMLSAVTIRA